MLDEEMDHIIREAADNHHPAYNDKAWEKMEIKLDKHLPQKTDRRRLIFFLLFFLLLGAGILFTVNKLSTDKDNVAEKNGGNSNGASVLTADNSTGKYVQDGNQIPVTQGAAEQTGGGSASSNAAPDKTTIIPGAAQMEGENTVNSGNHSSNRVLSKMNNGKASVNITNPDAFSDLEPGSVFKQKGKSITGKTAGKQSIAITNAFAEEDINNPGSSAPVIVKVEKVDEVATGKVSTEIGKFSKEPVKGGKKEKEPTKKTEDETSISTNADKKKSKNKFGTNFGLTASIGPDMSFVKLNNAGRTTLTYGAGLSYDIAKRFTARAGFYVSKKIYKATPDQYNPPGGNYPNLTGVDADCKVYEIPVSIAYNFGLRKNHSWFGNAGLSSFIMKKEDYTYNYKTPAGQTYAYYKEINNENKHYFAVLTLSAGYKYQLSRKLSMQAEPYAKIPLGGVGQGKIKLNSAGVMFTATLKPFKKKK